MRDRRIMALVGIVTVALIAAPGCVSNKKFKANVDDTDGRMTAVENAVEANDKKISNLKNDTDKRIGTVEQKANQASSVGNDALNKAQQAQKTAEGKLIWTVTITDDKVKFPINGTELSSDAMAALDNLVSKMKGYGKALYVEVEGHTDSTGDETYNMKLSEKRAQAVRSYLNQKGGIPLHAMNTIGFGESKPIADNSSKDGRAQNRRVVIRVLE